MSSTVVGANLLTRRVERHLGPAVVPHLSEGRLLAGAGLACRSVARARGWCLAVSCPGTRMRIGLKKTVSSPPAALVDVDLAGGVDGRPLHPELVVRDSHKL